MPSVEPYLEGILERLDRLIEVGEAIVDKLDAVDARTAATADLLDDIAADVDSIERDVRTISPTPPTE